MLPKRVLTGIDAAAFVVLSVLLIAGQFWALYVRPVSPLLHGQLFLGALLALTFLLIKHREGAGERVPWHDWLLAAISLIPALYAAWDYSAFVRRTILTTPTDIAMAVLLVALLMETCRRSIGWALPILSLLFLGYALAGNVAFLGGLGVPEISLRRLAGTMYISELGIFSEGVQVAVRWIFIFLLFGSFIMIAGGQDFFANLARSLNTRRRGGPAYVSVFSSAVFGMLSGSNMANVMTSGQFTIPLMRRAGYPPIIAATIESVASTGGALSPPIMAAGALIMAEFTARPYLDIILAATIPSILFYLSVLVYVAGVTRRLEIHAVMEQHQGTPILRLLAINWPIILSLFWLIYRIANFYPIERAGLEALLPLLVGALLHYRQELLPRALFGHLVGFVGGLVDVGIACAASGIMVGVILLSGIGVELSNFMFAIGSQNILAALFVTMLVTILLGMAVPGVAAYVITAAVVAPPLVQLGVPPIAAHMFIFYFSLFAGLTPPVALTAFAAAGIAGSPPFATGMMATVMAAPAYLVAYAFALEPGLLFEADAVTIVVQTIVSAAGISLFACGSSGYLYRRLSAVERAILCMAGAALIYPSLWGAALAAAIAAPLVFWFRLGRERDADTVLINKETTS